MPTLIKNPRTDIIYRINASTLGNINDPELIATAQPYEKSINWDVFFDTFFSIKKNNGNGNANGNGNNQQHTELIHNPNTTGKWALVDDLDSGGLQWVEIV